MQITKPTLSIVLLPGVMPLYLAPAAEATLVVSKTAFPEGNCRQDPLRKEKVQAQLLHSTIVTIASIWINCCDENPCQLNASTEEIKNEKRIRAVVVSLIRRSI